MTRQPSVAHRDERLRHELKRLIGAAGGFLAVLIVRDPPAIGHGALLYVLIGMFLTPYRWFSDSYVHGYWTLDWRASLCRVQHGEGTFRDLVAVRSDPVIRVAFSLGGLAMLVYGIWQLSVG
jgi:hypothetical protein